MNAPFRHIMIIVLLLSLTAHEVHSAAIHDVETCDVCVQVQTNDDSTADQQPQYLLYDDAFHIKTQAHHTILSPADQNAVEFIRGPPTFS